jgi:hypothetical protein
MEGNGDKEKYMAVRDRRLRGGVPARSHLAIVNTDVSTPLRALFHQIIVYAGTGKIHTLFVLCHGYAGTNRRMLVSADVGGMGLQLGQEGVVHSNVGLWGQIKNKLRNIVIYACAAADTQPGNEASTADGRYLLGALALITNADVYASNRIQWYTTYQDLPAGAFNFGRWEGKLYKFAANTGLGSIVPSVPVELTRVLNGTAP